MRFLAPVFVGSLLASASLQAAARPNIVVILSDDMGYSDVGCYGSEISTPNIDALAADGLRFTQFYNTARCCPTRASLLTGLHPHQAGIGHMMEDQGYPGYRGNLNHQCVTIAEALRPAGYRNYAVGKWHVTPGKSTKVLGDRSNWPLSRGFDRFYGTIHGAGSYFDPSSLVRDDRLITVANDAEYPAKDFFYTDAIADHAVKFIRDHKREQKDQPFFLYTAFTAAHWPLHAKPADIAKYKGKYDGGYEPTRAARLAKMRQLGLVDEKWQTSPPAEDWAQVKDKKFESECMEVYAAQIDCLDQGIGRIVAELKAQGIYENTLVFYLQDNGACAELIGRGNDATQRSEKPTLRPMEKDEQQFDSTPKQTRDGYPVRRGIGVTPGGADTYISYGRGWANVSDTPFREYKHWMHEGGISTPLIAHWPARISTERRGKLEKQPGQLVDIMATCLDISGAKYPAEFHGEKIKPFEGTSLLAALEGKELSRAKPLVWEHEGNRAVRDGQWKAVAKENQPWELYNLDKDRTETNDLATAEPERLKKMVATWQAWAERADVMPLGGWRGKGGGKTEASAAKSFALSAGSSLQKEKAPAIVDRAFTITAKVNVPDSAKGVIVAQGGTAHGYTLYVADGAAIFLARSAGKQATVSTPVPAGSHVIVAKLAKDGALSLQLDAQAEAKAPQNVVIKTQPLDGLDVGTDSAGLVGPYPADNAFTGKIDSIALELAPTEKAH